MQEKPPLVSLLESMGYEIYYWSDDPSEPEYTNVLFRELLGGLERLEIGNKRLYKHQYEALRRLEEGYNIILTARTGSGKTEAWALAALRNDWRVLAIYPTLALSADQIRRLERYYEVAGGGRDKVVRMDRPTLGRKGRNTILSRLSRAKLVITNPAFLLAEVKRIAQNPSRSLLHSFLGDLDLIVVDELDFYSPRSAHLIITVIDLIVNYLSARKPRIAVLSATLGNPSQLAEILTSINGRKTSIIEGKPFKVKNYTIVVLGKNIESLKNFILSYIDVIRQRASWILDIIDDDRELKEHLYEIYDGLEAIGLHPPRPGINLAEIIAALLNDKDPGVSLVFTRSIRHAERVYREILEQVPTEKSRLVAIHHHLVPKDVRESIENDARMGRVKVIVTVRTLAQGIDIGTITRIIHVGLPLDLREYLQREGRKGRRREIAFTETLIIPSGLWDRKLLEMGSSALREWLELPLEKLYITPRNKYALVFRAIWKLLRGLDLDSEEHKALLELGLVEESMDALGRPRLALNERGKRFWNEIGFYEHGPPYGYRKIVLSRAGQQVLPEEVSYRDLVEKYQPGCFDPITELIVVAVSTSERRVYEQAIDDAIEDQEWLTTAVARYEDIKRAWGEQPNLQADIKYGRISPIVNINVRAPRNGFGELVEEPLGVEWVIESRRPRLASAKGMVRTYREIGIISIDSPVEGRYRNYTYGYVFEAPGHLRGDDIRLGLALLMVFLRLDPNHAVPLGLIRYAVSSSQGVRMIHLWESDAAGIIDELDWMNIAKNLKKYEPPRIMVPLVSAIDPLSGLRLIKGEVSLKEALDYAASIAEAIAGFKLIEKGMLRIVVPKGRLNNVAAIALAYERIDDEQLLAVAGYDGSEVLEKFVRTGISVLESTKLAQGILEVLDAYLSRGHQVYYYGNEQRSLMIRLLSASYTGITMFRAAEEDGKLIDLSRKLREKIGDIPLLSILNPKLKSYNEWLARAKQRNDVDEVENALRSLASETAKSVYEALLVVYKGKVERLDKAS
ncbi:MAG: DEAD/DEAH box helicase [Pyrodictiaceae archaeon]